MTSRLAPLRSLAAVPLAAAAIAVGLAGATVTAPPSAAAATGATTSGTSITAGLPAGVVAGDYLLTVTGLSSVTPTFGSITQVVGGTGKAQRTADFAATPTAQSVTADVRVSGPADIFNIATGSVHSSWSSITLSPATWSFVTRGTHITSPSSADVVWHAFNAPPLNSDSDYSAMFAAYPAITGVRTIIDEECWDPFFTAAQATNYCHSFDTGSQTASAAYQARIAQIVNDITSTGRFAMLSVDVAGRDTANWQPASQSDRFGPDQHTLALYQQLASQFASNPMVVLETTNEPKMVPTSTYGPNKMTGSVLWRDGGTMTLNTITWHEPGVQQIVDTIRGAGFNNLVLVEAPSWGKNLTPIEKTPVVGTNLAYTFHGYNSPDNSTHYPWSWNNIVWPVLNPNGAYAYAGVLSEFGTALADNMTSNAGSQYLQSCITWANHYGLGWLANAWFPISWDQYGLVSSLQPVVVTPRGKTVVGDL